MHEKETRMIDTSSPARESRDPGFTREPHETRFAPACPGLLARETPLSESTRGFLTFTVKPWPGEEDYAGEASRPLPWKGFHVEPVAGEEGYKVHVVWLSSFRRFGGGHGAVLGGEGVLVTRGTDGWVAEVRSSWIT